MCSKSSTPEIVLEVPTILLPQPARMSPLFRMKREVLRPAAEVEERRRAADDVEAARGERGEAVVRLAAAGNVVVAEAAVDRVVAAVAAQGVVPRAALDRVGAVAALEGVVSLAAVDRVRAVAAGDRVVAVVAEQQIGVVAALDEVVAVAAVGLDRDADDVDEVDPVVADSADGDDLRHAAELLSVDLVPFERGRPHLHRPAVGLHEELLRAVGQVAVQAVRRVRSHCQRELAAALRSHEGRAIERDVEGEDREPRELELEPDRGQHEVDLDVCPQEQLELAGDVEHRKRVAAVREDVRLELVDADLPVAVEVGEVEEDRGCDAALDADRRDPRARALRRRPPGQ